MKDVWLDGPPILVPEPNEVRDITYCDQESADDPRFMYAEDTFDPPPGTWAPDCGHEACLADDVACAETGHYWDCAVAECRHAAAHNTCDLPINHPGDHSYALPATPNARLVPYSAPKLQVMLIQVAQP